MTEKIPSSSLNIYWLQQKKNKLKWLKNLAQKTLQINENYLETIKKFHDSLDLDECKQKSLIYNHYIFNIRICM